ncbi:26S proteasome non-ATPase regulatory subunit 8 [Clarias magur]|uniref:26S proteasome non-ATPase regulatory subunit 8 n=1 Tax=Clarias magur TaxID=1594786 RepID=A0A8J4UUF4_CLAMG|nr:26S proteasome non-ATPase regulatory subunit 8 [Clarias magur]
MKGTLLNFGERFESWGGRQWALGSCSKRQWALGSCRRRQRALDICGRRQWDRTEILLKSISLLELNFLPTTGTKLAKQQLILARDVLEIGALWSILKKDIPSFERYMAQLKCYYFDYKDELPESAYIHQLLGLNLLFLLSQNRVSEFHTELERLSAKDIQTNVYIRHPVSLEQYLMEGSYNKVFLAKGNIPAESYTFFIDILLDTIRDEIAGCIEKAYEQIQFTEATRVLFFSTPKKMTEYAKKRGWTQSPDGYYSFSPQQQRTEENVRPTMRLSRWVAPKHFMEGNYDDSSEAVELLWTGRGNAEEREKRGTAWHHKRRLGKEKLVETR